MSTFRKRTWQTRTGPKTAWLVDYHHDGKRKFETFKTEKDARARLHEIEGERKAGTHIPTRDSIKLDEACNLWLENKQYVRKVERSTLKGYVEHVENYIKPKLGHHRLAKLTAPMIDHFYTQLVRSHSSTLAAKVMVSLRGVLKRAMTAGLIGQNVASAVELHRNTRDKEKLKAGTHFPSKEEVNAIIEHARGHWRPFFVTAIYTGMRASEMRGLEWSAVDIDEKTITVNQRANLWGDIGAPKSASSRRDIRLPPMALNTLREWRLKCPKNPVDGKLKYVFPKYVKHHGIETGIESHYNITNNLNSTQRRAGIVDADGNPKYSVHSLRHFYASWIIELGFSPRRCMDLLGHSSMKMTFDTYGHLFPSPEDDDARLAAGEAALLAVGGKG